MSFHEYKVSQDIAARDYPFYSLIMAAIRKADTPNTTALMAAFPFVYHELTQRYNAPDGRLEGD